MRIPAVMLAASTGPDFSAAGPWAGACHMHSGCHAIKLCCLGAPPPQVGTATAELAALGVDLSSEARRNLLTVAECSLRSAATMGKGLSASEAGSILTIIDGAGGSITSSGLSASDIRSSLQTTGALLLSGSSVASSGGIPVTVSGISGLYLSVAAAQGSSYNNKLLATGTSTGSQAAVTILGQLAGSCGDEDGDAAAGSAPAALCASSLVGVSVTYIADGSGHVQLPAAAAAEPSRRLLAAGDLPGLIVVTGVVELAVEGAGQDGSLPCAQGQTSCTATVSLPFNSTLNATRQLVRALLAIPALLLWPIAASVCLP